MAAQDGSKCRAVRVEIPALFLLKTRAFSFLPAGANRFAA